MPGGVISRFSVGGLDETAIVNGAGQKSVVGGIVAARPEDAIADIQTLWLVVFIKESTVDGDGCLIGESKVGCGLIGLFDGGANDLNAGAVKVDFGNMNPVLICCFILYAWTDLFLGMYQGGQQKTQYRQETKQEKMKHAQEDR